MSNTINVDQLQHTIVIGMGGTGINTLLKLKSLVHEKAPEIIEQNKLILLGLDTEPYNRSKFTDKDTGVGLAQREYLAMGLGVSIDKWIKALLELGNRKGL